MKNNIIIEFRSKYPKMATGVAFFICDKNISIHDFDDDKIFADVLMRFDQEDVLSSEDIMGGGYSEKCYIGTAVTPVMLFEKGMPVVKDGDEGNIDLIKIIPVPGMVVYALDPDRVKKESIQYLGISVRSQKKFYKCLDAGLKLASERGSFLIAVCLVGWDMNFNEFNFFQKRLLSKIGYVCNNRK